MHLKHTEIKIVGYIVQMTLTFTQVYISEKVNIDFNGKISWQNFAP